MPVPGFQLQLLTLSGIVFIMKINSFYQNAFYSLSGLIVGFIVAMLVFYKPACHCEKVEKPLIENINSVPDSVPSLLIAGTATAQVFPSVKMERKSRKVDSQPSETPVVVSENNVPLNNETLMEELIRQGVHHPEIVLAQAKLETGHYTSKLCKNKNNLFGLRGRKGYMAFNTWQESVTAYRDKVQYKYKGGDYFEFLENIGYAEDKKYVQHVKKLMKA